MRFKSFKLGVSKFRRPIYGLGLLTTVTALVSLIANAFSIEIHQIPSTVLAAYDTIVRVPILSFMAFLFGLRISPQLVDVLVVYSIFGTAVARTRSAIQEAMSEAPSQAFLVDETRAGFNVSRSWRSYTKLFMKLEWNKDAESLSPIQKFFIGLRFRLDAFYKTSPTALRVAFDVGLFPVSMYEILREPIYCYVDNQNNPEDNYHTMRSADEVKRVNNDPYWIFLRPQTNFLYFFAGQFCCVVLFTTAFFVMNSALTEWAPPSSTQTQSEVQERQ